MMPERVSPAEPAGGGEGLQRVWERILERGARIETEREAEQLASRPLFAELMSAPQDQRSVKVVEDMRFWTLAFVDRLLQATDRTSASTTSANAELALEIVQRLDERHYGAASLAGRQAVARCLWADARRREGNLSAAEIGFRDAARCLSAEPLDARERALYCRRLSALRRDQERDDETLALLRRAVELYQLWDEPLLAAEALCAAADLWISASDPETALALFQEAEESAGTPTALPDVPIRVQHGLARCYAQLGETESAEKALCEARAQYRLVLHPVDRLCCLWAEALIVGEGEPGNRAIAKLRPVFRRMVDEGAFYNAALVVLDLARFMAEQAQVAEVRRLAEQAAPLLQQLPELAGSVLRFALRFAGRLRPGAAELLEQASTYLKQARENPHCPLPWDDAWTELVWGDDLPLDLKRHLCEEAGLASVLASLPASALSLRDQQLVTWTYQVIAHIRVRFDAQGVTV